MKRRQVIQSSGLFIASAVATSLLPVHKAQASIDHQIHVLNRSSEPIYVLPSPNPDYTWPDIAFSAATSLAVSALTGGTGVVATAAGIVDSIKTLETIITIVNLVQELHNDGFSARFDRLANENNINSHELARAAERDRQRVTTFLQRHAVRIEPNEFKRIFEVGVWHPIRYMSASGIASAFEGSDMTLSVFTESLSRMARFNSNSDHSWIVKNHEVVRSRYGDINQESKGDGFCRFSVGNTLYSSQALSPGESLSSSQGALNLVYQEDGNAVVYRRWSMTEESPIWSTNTQGKSLGELLLQDDGNLVIYDANREVAWAHNRNLGTSSSCKLVMQDDGNLVVYRGNAVVWATNCYFRHNPQGRTMMELVENMGFRCEPM